MAYLSLYRKYRSQTFSDLIGQGHVVRTLQNGITSERIAHAYLFTGPRGTGKTSTARLLAKALCCENGPTAEPDNVCEICRDITAGACVDVVELDAASESGVEDIREKIVEVAEYRPMVARYKVFIIDEVHDLSGKAFDALLKTIEEPPPHLIFILATTEYNKVPPTIRSRCQKFEFHRASMSDLVARLKHVAQGEGVEVEPSALTAIARMADGGFRDALTLLEQAILTSEDGRITLAQVYDQLGLVSEEVVDSLLMAIRERDVPRIMEVLAEVARLGRDPRAILESMLYRLQDITRASYQLDLGDSDAAREASLHETATRLGREFTLAIRGALAEAHKVIRDVSLPRLWLESELVRISQMATAPEPRREAAPPAEPTRPRRETRPTEAPAPTPPAAVEAPKPAPTVAEAPGMDGELAAVWAQVIASLPSGDKVPPITRRMRPAQLVAVDGNTLTIELARQTDIDWMHENPARIGHIRKLVAEHAGKEFDLKWIAAKRERGPAEPETVELPAEGDRLEQLARQVFEQN